VHQFGGYAFDPDGGVDGGGCLEAAGVVDVLEGPDPTKPCADVRCWVGPDGTAYITNMACDGPPDFQDETHATSGPCVKALGAYEADGGKVSCPAPPPDAGS
jgi:hypothetical protein